MAVPLFKDKSSSNVSGKIRKVSPPPHRAPINTAKVMRVSKKLSPDSRSPEATEADLPWSLKHSPTQLGDVAMHAARVNDIAKALEPGSATRVLVLSGPAGSSKSTAIKMIAESRGQRVVEFHAPESLVGSTSLVNSFREFLLGAAMYDREKTIILVEELPAIFHEDTQRAFDNSLTEWSQEAGRPIVAVAFTEIEVSAKYNEAVIVSRVLTELISSSRLEVIWLKTNPVNATLLRQKLKIIAKAENYDVPNAIITALAGCGDIRSAINSLELYCRAPPRSGGSVVTDNLWIRGSPVELFYAIGKVVWTSSKEGSLEESLDMFEDSMDMFNLTILENYTSAKHQRLPAAAAAAVTEWLSVSDMWKPNNSIGALGAASVIADSQPSLKLPKTFVQTRFTQYPKWQSEKFAEQSKFVRSLGNMRQSGDALSRDELLDQKSFAKFFSRRNTPNDMLDESDDDDDF